MTSKINKIHNIRKLDNIYNQVNVDKYHMSFKGFLSVLSKFVQNTINDNLIIHRLTR